MMHSFGTRDGRGRAPPPATRRSAQRGSPRARGRVQSPRAAAPPCRQRCSPSEEPPLRGLSRAARRARQRRPAERSGRGSGGTEWHCTGRAQGARRKRTLRRSTALLRCLDRRKGEWAVAWSRGRARRLTAARRQTAGSRMHRKSSGHQGAHPCCHPSTLGCWCRDSPPLLSRRCWCRSACQREPRNRRETCTSLHHACE